MSLEFVDILFHELGDTLPAQFRARAFALLLLDGYVITMFKKS